jgi:hypothetical protein
MMMVGGGGGGGWLVKARGRDSHRCHESWQGKRWIDGVDDDNQVNQIRKSSSYEGELAS